MDENEQREILHRLDERTAYIENSVSRIDKRLERQEAEITSAKQLAEENQTKIAIGTFTGGTILTALIAKLAGVLPW